VEPWLPFGDVAACNVADQRADPASVLEFTRAAIALRRELADLRAGAYTELVVGDAVWAWRRGASTVVALNLGSEPATVALDGVSGAIRFGTRAGREGERCDGAVALTAREGVVVLRDAPA